MAADVAALQQQRIGLDDRAMGDRDPGADMDVIADLHIGLDHAVRCDRNTLAQTCQRRHVSGGMDQGRDPHPETVSQLSHQTAAAGGVEAQGINLIRLGGEVVDRPGFRRNRGERLKLRPAPMGPCRFCEV